jgi:hypothetical protein
MTFNNLKTSWQKLVQNTTYTADQYSQTVEVPLSFFEDFQKEFNVCFIEPDEDTEFLSWQDGWHDE